MVSESQLQKRIHNQPLPLAGDIKVGAKLRSRRLLRAIMALSRPSKVPITEIKG